MYYKAGNILLIKYVDLWRVTLLPVNLYWSLFSCIEVCVITYFPLESWQKQQEMQKSIKQICKTIKNNNYFVLTKQKMYLQLFINEQSSAINFDPTKQHNSKANWLHCKLLSGLFQILAMSLSETNWFLIITCFKSFSCTPFNKFQTIFCTF